MMTVTKKEETYPELWLESQSENLGIFFDIAINECGYSPKKITDYFIKSKMADLMSKGHPRFSAGCNGEELLMLCLDTNNVNSLNIEEMDGVQTSKEYWAGYMLAIYQWESGRNFVDILKAVPLSKIIEAYTPLHESSEEKFYDVMEHWISDVKGA
ncbi:transcriptional regulator [Selenomonas ruminantium]|uniref:transcriptional regulator n=1 Tax=Selenomonas ruminantium TaxID=971 RepID=UPI0026EBC14D|nr:transcriptional regulator [Selenomonas ruminantium]